MVIGAVLMLCIGGFVKLYIIGEPISGAQVHSTLSMDGLELTLRVDAVEPAAALRGWKWTQDGGRLSITARKVPLSPLFSTGHYETVIDTETVDTILLGGKIIWSRSG